MKKTALSIAQDYSLTTDPPPNQQLFPPHGHVYFLPTPSVVLVQAEGIYLLYLTIGHILQWLG